MPLALWALTLSAFAIGTTEFVIVGLIPTIAAEQYLSLGIGLLQYQVYLLIDVQHLQDRCQEYQLGQDLLTRSFCSYDRFELKAF